MSSKGGESTLQGSFFVPLSLQMPPSAFLLLGLQARHSGGGSEPLDGQPFLYPPSPTASDSVKPLEKVQRQKKTIKSECSNAISPEFSGDREASACWETGLRNPKRLRR